MTAAPSQLTCPRCRMTTHHPVDITEGYCPNCHDWTSQPSGPDGRPMHSHHVATYGDEYTVSHTEWTQAVAAKQTADQATAALLADIRTALDERPHP